jgi:hypothetical protein
VADLLARRGKDVPARAELRGVLALRLTGAGVLDEAVERVPGIGHLRLAAGAVCDPEERSLAVSLLRGYLATIIM